MHSMWFSHRRYRLCLVGCKIFSGKENIFKCLVAFQKIFWKIFSGVWLYSWKCSRKPIFIMFLTFSHIFSASKQIYHQIQQNPNSQYPTKKKKKIIKSEINPKSENNKTRTTHATTITTRKSEIKESKRIGDEIDPEEDQPRASRSVIRRDDLGFDEWCDDFWVRDYRWRMGSTISGFMTIGVKWVWRFLGSRSEEWVRRRNLSLSVFAHLSPCFSRSLSLFGHCSTNELGLGFSGFVGALGCGLISPSPVLGC